MIKFNIHSVKFGKGGFKYNRLLKAIQYDNRISALARLVHLTMLESDDYKPTLDRLAKQYEVCPATIDRAILELKKFGYIVSSGSKEHTVYDVYAIPVNIKFEVKKYRKVNLKNEVNINLTDDALLVIPTQTVKKSLPDVETSIVTFSPPVVENDTSGLVESFAKDADDFDRFFENN